MTDDQIRSIEQKTRDQRLSPLWHSKFCFRITASYFRSVLDRKESTPPNNLVISSLQLKKFPTAAAHYRINTESTADMWTTIGHQSYDAYISLHITLIIIITICVYCNFNILIFYIFIYSIFVNTAMRQTTSFEAL